MLQYLKLLTLGIFTSICLYAQGETAPILLNGQNLPGQCNINQIFIKGGASSPGIYWCDPSTHLLSGPLSKVGGNFGPVTGTAPISVNNGATVPVISIDDTAVTPGSYTSTDLTVDAKGRITAASNGSGAGGAPTNATYITQTANGTLSAEQALASLATGCMASTITTGVVATRTITGTTNQITVTNGDCSGAPTISIPTNPTLPGNTTGTFIGNLTGNVIGNASTATALAANPTDCGANQFANAIAASGNLTCATPAGSGDVVGPGSATDNAIARFDGTTGKLIQNSVGILDDSGNASFNSIALGGATNACDGTGGCAQFGQGTAPSGLPTTGIQEIAPTSVTSYKIVKPGTVGVTGFVKSTVSGTTRTDAPPALLVTADIPVALTNQTSLRGNSMAAAAGDATIGQVIAHGSKALDFASTATGACATVITDTATGAASTDVVIFNANASIKAVTGYVPASTGGFSISAFPSTNTISFEACNWTAGTVDPGSITVNWVVIR